MDDAITNVSGSKFIVRFAARPTSESKNKNAHGMGRWQTCPPIRNDGLEVFEGR
jgi:hypothetical protein